MPSAAPADPRPVLVAGASGYLGGHLARELLRRGVPVRALVRATDAQAARELQAAGAECLAVDATQPGALVGVCDGCRAVASCLAADMHWRSGTPDSVDRDANIALFQEAAATTVAAADTAGGGGGSSASNGGGASSKGGVARFLLVATFEGREARAAVPMQRAKEAAVDYIEHMAGGYPGLSWTIVRPTAYFKDFTDYPWQRMQRSNWMLVPGGGRARYNPIDGAELAEFMADCLLDPAQCANQEVRIGGPQVLTFRETMYLAAEALGKPRQSVRIVTLPVLLLRCAAALLALLAPVWPAAAPVAGALRFAIYGSTHDSVGLRYGHRTVADHYRELRAQLDEERRQRRGAPQGDGSEQQRGPAKEE